MGWSLKKTGSRTQFTEGQRKFPTDQFLIGEECGKKADPQPQARFSGDCDVQRRNLRKFLKGEAPSLLF